VHGSNCQAIYQPAAAAEARFAASLQGNSSSPASSTDSSASAAEAEQNSSPSRPSTPTAAATAGSEQQQQQQDVSLSQQLHEVVPDSAKELVRDILREDNRARTKQLVDDAWQTLE
jgi:guanyl-specific ribonuclease Sa